MHGSRKLRRIEGLNHGDSCPDGSTFPLADLVPQPLPSPFSVKPRNTLFTNACTNACASDALQASAAGILPKKKKKKEEDESKDKAKSSKRRKTA